MDIFTIIRRLIDAGAGRVISEAEHQLLHLELNKHDPSVPSEEEAARQAEAAAAAAKAEQDEFAQFKAWKDARDAAAATTLTPGGVPPTGSTAPTNTGALGGLGG